jgi:hypothetical protein
VRGTLGAGALPLLLRAIHVGRRTGSLHIASGEQRHTLRFRRGQVVNSRTSVPGERLGETMVRHGLLTPHELARASTIVIATRRRLGAVLLDMDVIDAGRLSAAIELHVRELLGRLTAWTQGTYAFEEEDEAAVADELTLGFSTAELVLDAWHAVRDPRVVREALGDTDRLVVPAADPELRAQQLPLSPADAFVLSRIDGTTSAREVVQAIPLPAEQVERSLLNLLSTGLVEYRSRQSAAADAAGPAPATPRTERATPIGGTAIASTPPPASATAGTPGTREDARPATPDPAARRREILEAAQGLKERNHFEVLGLPRTAREADVKEAYFRLAKRFHPDVHHTEALADLKDALESVFIRLGEAYEVLRDPRKRADYEDRLGRPRTTSSPAVQASSQPSAAPAMAAAAPATPPSTTPAAGLPTAPPAGPDPPDADVGLEQRYHHAARHHAEERFWDAIQLLEPIVGSATGKLGSAARVLLARCYLRNPKWARRAEETLLEATRADPAAVEAWAVLGSIYAGNGMRTRACSMYRKVLELKPQHEEASSYLAAHGADDPESPEDSSGMLRRLFRR